MRVSDLRGTKTRLRLGIGLFVLALAIPSLLLTHKAYDQIKWEAFRQQQLAAEELAGRIDRAIAALVRTEDGREVEDYGFLVEAGDPSNPYRGRSPLAELSAIQVIPGLLGWFQVAADGGFSTPLVPRPGVYPEAFGVGPAELALRQAQAQRIQGILIGNRLVERGSGDGDTRAAGRTQGPARRPDTDSADETSDLEQAAEAGEELLSGLMSRPAAPASQSQSRDRLSQAAFERLAADRVAPSPLQKKEETAGLRRIEETRRDTELAEPKRRASLGLPAPTAAAPAPAPVAGRIQRSERAQPQPAGEPSAKSVQLFESAVEPNELGRLDSGHLLLFRRVWREGERIIQGALIEQATFLERLVRGPFKATALARTSDLTVAYRGEVLATYHAVSGSDYRVTAPPLTGALLYRTRLMEPFGGLELIFSVSRLPNPPGAAVIGWMSAALALVLLAGTWLMYRLGLSQIDLVRQQQDFVSAVSHELKTPLTSIRMYAEMLRAGFATDERKATYYRFIHEESERLSRLIANVLQLARIGRGALVLEPRPVAIQALMAMVRERTSSQVERAGFRLEMACEDPVWVLADPDAFVQILINLVDNALKFAAGAQTRRVLIGCRPKGGDQLCVWVRDFGPGIPRSQRRRVFQLFYRGAQAKQLAITGTGIGLALVQRLIHAMQGRVEVVNAEPGAEFRVELPLAKPDED